jgi:hypothetical protein
MTGSCGVVDEGVGVLDTAVDTDDCDRAQALLAEQPREVGVRRALRCADGHDTRVHGLVGQTLCDRATRDGDGQVQLDAGAEDGAGHAGGKCPSSLVELQQGALLETCVGTTGEIHDVNGVQSSAAACGFGRRPPHSCGTAGAGVDTDEHCLV